MRHRGKLTEGQHDDKGLVRIARGKCRVNRRRIAPDIAGGENPPVHRHQMRGKHDPHRPPGEGREFLVELAQMPVPPALRIARHILGPLGKEHVLLERPPRPGDAVLEVADDVVKVDQAAFDQRAKCELHGRRIAARPRDKPRLADILAIEFGQAIDRLGLQFRRDMGRAVPCLVVRHIAQTEIRAKVDHLHILRQALDQGLRQPVRQRAEDKLDLREIHLLDGDKPRQVKMAQMRKDIGHRLPRLAVGGQRGDAQGRMRRDDPDKLCPGIARGSQYRDTACHLALHLCAAPP